MTRFDRIEKLPESAVSDALANCDTTPHAEDVHRELGIQLDRLGLRIVADEDVAAIERRVKDALAATKVVEARARVGRDHLGNLVHMVEGL